MKHIQSALFVILFFLTGCGKQAQTVEPTVTTVPATTSLSPTETSIPAAATPVPTLDPAVFGAIGTSEIRALALESVANAIFTKAMDEFVTSGPVQEYQVTSVTIFPGSGGLLSEIRYNVKTSDPGWRADGGTPSADGWINGNCSRFDFFTTETEYQLKNRRLCS